MSAAHLSGERIQEWLEGGVPAGDAARIQAHLDGCARCRAEVQAWEALLRDLATLPALSPREGFRGRVLDAVGRTQPTRLPLAARVRAALSARTGRRAALAHPDGARIQQLLDGSLRGRRAGPLREHLAACADCREEARAWGALMKGLDALPRLEPAPGFADAVMARVRVPQAAPARAALARRLLDRARALAGPRHRTAWAAAAGVAFTPAVTVGLVAYVVFSHPLVTVGSLLSFVGIKGGAAIDALAAGVTGGLVESAALFRAWTAVDALARSPATAGAGLLAFSALTLTAAWVLYRNLFVAPSTQPPYANLS